MEEIDLKEFLIERREEITEKIKNHEKVLLEELQSQFKVIAEVHLDHTHKLNTLLEIVANNTENI